MWELFKKRGELTGTIEITELPPFKGYSISLSLFRASGPDAPVPFSGDPPPKARRDVEELKQAIHFEREDASGVIQESFRLRRPVGWYYLQLSVILYRQQNDKTYAQLERFFFRRCRPWKGEVRVGWELPRR